MSAILFINALDRRYGSTYRARNLVRILHNLGYPCIYAESNGVPSAVFDEVVSIDQPDTIGGYAVATCSRIKLVLTRSYDILIIQKLTPLTVPAIIAGRVSGHPVVVDWDDLDAEFQKNLFRRCLTAICQRIGILFASSVTVHNSYLDHEAREIGCRNVWYVPQPIDTVLFDPRRFEHVSQKDRLGLRGRLVVGYIGTLTTGGIRDIDAILRWVGDIRDHQACHLLIAGGGPQETELRKLLFHYGIHDFTITGMLQQEQMPEYISAMDVCAVYMRDNPGNRARVSLKVLEALCMLRPVVGVVVGLTQDKFNNYILPFDKFHVHQKKEYIDSLVHARSLIEREHSLEAVQTYIGKALREYARTNAKN